MRWLIVGAGAAGCAIAGTLLTAGEDVVIIERGGASSRAVHERVARRPGRIIDYVQGSGLGGSSLINAGVGTRTLGPAAHLPVEHPTDLGPVGAALKVAHPEAEPVMRVSADGERMSAADIYLPDVDTPGLTLIADTTVRWVESISHSRPTVVTDDDTRIEGDRIVLCAGAIHTAAICLRSGVTTGVGTELHDDPGIFITLDLSVPNPETTWPVTTAVAGGGRQIVALNHLRDPGWGGLSVSITGAASRGTITLDSAGNPQIELAQLTQADDHQRLVDAVAEAQEMLAHRAFAEIGSDARFGVTREPVAGADLDTAVIDNLDGVYHLVGSCPRGVVTTDDGWVPSLPGVAIGDASLFASVPSHNLYLSVMVQAERLASGWLVGRR